MPVDDHGRGNRDVRPMQVVICQGLHIDIHDPQVVVIGHQAGDSQQPQWRECGLFSDQFQGFVKTPKRHGIFRIHEKRVGHGVILSQKARINKGVANDTSSPIYDIFWLLHQKKSLT